MGKKNLGRRMFDVGGFFCPEGLPANQNCPRFEHMMVTMSFGKPTPAKKANFGNQQRSQLCKGQIHLFSHRQGA